MSERMEESAKIVNRSGARPAARGPRSDAYAMLTPFSNRACSRSKHSLKCASCKVPRCRDCATCADKSLRKRCLKQPPCTGPLPVPGAPTFNMTEDFKIHREKIRSREDRAQIVKKRAYEAASTASRLNGDHTTVIATPDHVDHVDLTNASETEEEQR